ncbi:DNA-binding response regulator [bacterium 1XD21-13]|nr:DNA-binding response regulator [bacterium 1XD21-13]
MRGGSQAIKRWLRSVRIFSLEYSEIAQTLSITERTVKYHVSNILQKTGYANKTRLAIAVTGKKFIIPSLPEDLDFDITK